MDLDLIRTFLEVASTGSFGAASGRLHLTQSAVSLRVQRLEVQLGRPLFDRKTSGVELTPAGREFRGFATTIIRNWEQARQRVSALESQPLALAVAAPPSLWPRFGFGWLDRLQEAQPDLSVKAEVGRPAELAQMIMSGSVQAILLYEALHRPGLQAERLMEDQLVLVSPWPDISTLDLDGRYAFVDWGTEFRAFHDETLPELADARLTLGMGSLAAWYLRNRPYAAYLPARVMRPAIADGTMHLVRDAPSFALPSWVIWRDDTDANLRAVAEATLAEAVKRAQSATAEVLEQL